MGLSLWSRPVRLPVILPFTFSRSLVLAGWLWLSLISANGAFALGSNEFTYDVNGHRLTYNLATVWRHATAERPGASSLKPGASKIRFVALTDASLVSEPRTKIGASVSRVRSSI